MCYICSCLSSILDGVQRVVTFGLACWMCFALCIGMIVASVAGIAYGYNYCMAEFLTLTSRSEVTVFMRRGKFYDPPDIKSPLIHPTGGRRSGGGFEEELNANMSSDYDENMRRAQEAASKSLGETWVKSDDTRRYAERLTKFSDNVDSKDVIRVSVLATPSTTMADSRRANADDSGKYSEFGKIQGDNDAERSKTPMFSTSLAAQKYGDYNNIDKTWKYAEELSKYGGGGKLVVENTPTRSTTLDTRYAESTWKLSELLSKVDSKAEEAKMAKAFTYSTSLDAQKYIDYNNIDKTWKYAEELSKYGGGGKLVVENTPTSTTTLDTRYRSKVDNSWQFAEQLSKYRDGIKAENNVVKVETPAPFVRPSRTPGMSEFHEHKEVAASRGPDYRNFLKPLRTTDSRKTITPEDINNYAKGRMNSRRTTQKRSDSKIKFVERKHQDSKATPAPMRHWAIRTTTRASSEEYSSSEEDDEDIVYKSV